jgi:hypothetical protein
VVRHAVEPSGDTPSATEVNIFCIALAARVGSLQLPLLSDPDGKSHVRRHLRAANAEI